MIVLHVSFLENEAYIWGEAGGSGQPPVTAKPAAGVRQHPFEVGANLLIKALGKVAPEIKFTKKRIGSRFIWLPARGGIPFPSSSILGWELSGRGRKQIIAFGISCVKVSVDELIILAANSKRHWSGVIFSAAWHWLEAALHLVFDLSIKQNYLPALVEKEDAWAARWLPLPDEDDDEYWQQLALAIPAEVRSMSTTFTKPGAHYLSKWFAELIEQWLDYLARQFGRQEEGLNRELPTPKRSSRNRHPSIHDAWLHALNAPDGSLDWPQPYEAKAFSEQLWEWRRSVITVRNASYRFCMRLVEPNMEPDSDEAWRIEYLLQSKQDPSLLVPVSEIWKNRSKGRKLLEAGGSGNLTEFIYTILGQAAVFSSGVARSLQQKNPGGYEADHQDAYRFISEEAPTLQSIGIRVILPAWWVGKGTTTRIAVKIKAMSPKLKSESAELSLAALLQYDVQASLGGMEIDLKELKALAQHKQPLVKVRGQWFMVDAEQIAQAVKFMEKQQALPISARQALNMALGDYGSFGGLEVEQFEFKGWLQDLLEQLKGERALPEPELPTGLMADLRPYQRRVYAWLAFQRYWGLGACLADDMGLGKTLQALCLVLREYQQGEKRPVLLLCPTSVVNNWQKEAERFAPDLPVIVHHGPDRRRKAAFKQAANQHAMVISSYSLVQRDADFLQEIDWAGIILDEAQYVKNPETKQSKAVRSMSADYRIALTGTPIENHVGELWSLMDFLNPGLLGTQAEFKRQYHRPIQVYQDQSAAQRLKTLTAPFIMRRLKTDRSIISDLPDKIEVKEFCTLTREQASLYQAVVNEAGRQLDGVEGIERKGLVLSTLMKLKQVCNHPAHFLGDGSDLSDRSGKCERLMDILDQVLDNKERVLIFTQFAEMGHLLQTYLQEGCGEEVLFLHGGTSKKKRDQMVEHFQTKAEAPKIFVLSLKAGGTGLNLVSANHVIHFDRWWNPAVENQATDRAYRIGQHKNVVVHKFSVAGTLEERIDAMIERKSSLAGSIVGAGEQWLSELSNDELTALIGLDESARRD